MGFCYMKIIWIPTLVGISYQKGPAIILNFSFLQGSSMKLTFSLTGHTFFYVETMRDLKGYEDPYLWNISSQQNESDSFDIIIALGVLCKNTNKCSNLKILDILAFSLERLYLPMIHLLSCRHGKLIQTWHIHLSLPITSIHSPHICSPLKQ